MRYGTSRMRRFTEITAPRTAWRGWAGPANASVVDGDLATMLDRRDDSEIGLRTQRGWSRRRW